MTKTKKRSQPVSAYLYALLAVIILASGIFIYRRLDTNPAPVANVPIDINQLTQGVETDPSQLMKCNYGLGPIKGCNFFFYSTSLHPNQIDIIGTSKKGSNAYFGAKVDHKLITQVEATFSQKTPSLGSDKTAGSGAVRERYGLFIGGADKRALILRAAIYPTKGIYRLSYMKYVSPGKYAWKKLEQKEFALPTTQTPVSMKMIRAGKNYQVFAKIEAQDSQWQLLSDISFSTPRYTPVKLNFAGIMTGAPQGFKDIPDTAISHFGVTNYSLAQIEKDWNDYNTVKTAPKEYKESEPAGASDQLPDDSPEMEES